MQKIIAVLAVLAAAFLLVGEVAAQTATATGTANVSAGNSMAVNGTGNQQSITLQGGEIPKQLPQPVTAPVSVPQVFQVLPNQAGLPAELMGAALDDVYLSLCDPSGGANVLPLIQKDGKSGKTKFSFAAHQNLGWMRDGEQLPEVRLNYTGRDTIRCLGMLIIQVTPDAVKDGYPMGLSALSVDAMNSVAEVVKGIGSVVLLSHRSFWGGSLGLSAQGTGRSVGVGFNLGFSVSGGVSNVNGSNSPVSRMSVPFIVGVRVPADDQYAVAINLLPAPPAPTGAPVGGNGKKLQAIP